MQTMQNRQAGRQTSTAGFTNSCKVLQGSMQDMQDCGGAASYILISSMQKLKTGILVCLPQPSMYRPLSIENKYVRCCMQQCNNKQQTFKVWQPQRAARSKRPNTPSDGSKHNGFQTTNQAVLIPKHATEQNKCCQWWSTTTILYAGLKRCEWTP